MHEQSNYINNYVKVMELITFDFVLITFLNFKQTYSILLDLTVLNHQAIQAAADPVWIKWSCSPSTYIEKVFQISYAFHIMRHFCACSVVLIATMPL